MTHNEKFINRVIYVAEKYIIKDIDGYYKINIEGGFVNSSELKIIANHLDKLNEEYENTLTSYFEEENKH